MLPGEAGPTGPGAAGTQLLAVLGRHSIGRCCTGALLLLLLSDVGIRAGLSLVHDIPCSGRWHTGLQLLLLVGASIARLLSIMVGLLAGHLLAPCPGVYSHPWLVLNFWARRLLQQCVSRRAVVRWVLFPPSARALSYCLVAASPSLPATVRHCVARSCVYSSLPSVSNACQSHCSALLVCLRAVLSAQGTTRACLYEATLAGEV